VADGYPIPQRAAVSTYRGHHWIIEDCDIRFINAVAIDVGNESCHRNRPVDPSIPTNYRAQRAYLDNRPDMGRHIIRRNLTSDCGVCGIAGVGNVRYTLIEDNTIQNVATVDIERLWETAGLKLHICSGVLIRRNILRGIPRNHLTISQFPSRSCVQYSKFLLTRSSQRTPRFGNRKGIIANSIGGS